jgi:hypothetical protein
MIPRNRNIARFHQVDRVIQECGHGSIGRETMTGFPQMQRTSSRSGMTA